MSPVGSAILLAGTNTEVGKTVVGVLLAATLARQGKKILALKPVESGCEPDAEDAQAWSAVTGQEMEQVCPYRFRLPIAPQSAAEAEGREVEMSVIQQILRRCREAADLTLVESAGGLGSPLAPGTLVIDLARALELPVLLVAPHTLGSVGQTLVNTRLLEHEGIKCVGVVLSRHTQDPEGPESSTHAPLLAEHGRGVPLLGILPHLGPIPSSRPPEAFAAWVAAQVPTVEANLNLNPLASL